MAAPDILNRIVEEKWREIKTRSNTTPLAELESIIAGAGGTRGFADAIGERAAAGQPAVIAELKKASPSRGIIREAFDPGEIAVSYETGGATCLSVLTDTMFFSGSNDDLSRARQATALPVLRKDFIVDPYQVYEARAIGADCILLIVSVLDAMRLKVLNEVAVNLGMDVLVEVHDALELETAMGISPRLIGINNRDLRTFDVDLGTTYDLAGRVPKGTTVVTESGIRTRADVASMLEQGIYSFLVGEAFMVDKDPGAKLRALFS